MNRTSLSAKDETLNDIQSSSSARPPVRRRRHTRRQARRRAKRARYVMRLHGMSYDMECGLSVLDPAEITGAFIRRHENSERKV